MRIYHLYVYAEGSEEEGEIIITVEDDGTVQSVKATEGFQIAYKGTDAVVQVKTVEVRASIPGA